MFYWILSLGLFCHSFTCFDDDWKIPRIFFKIASKNINHFKNKITKYFEFFSVFQGKCQRKDPPCKYLHPPQHLREQLLQNGRNNLILKNLQMQAAAAQTLIPSTGIVPGMLPTIVSMETWVGQASPRVYVYLDLHVYLAISLICQKQ